MEGLCGGLVIEEVPDQREQTDIRHVQPGHGRVLVVGVGLLGSVQLPDVPGLVRSGEHTPVQESHQALKSQFSFVDSPRSGKRSDKIAWRGPCCWVPYHSHGILLLILAT